MFPICTRRSYQLQYALAVGEATNEHYRKRKPTSGRKDKAEGRNEDYGGKRNTVGAKTKHLFCEV